MTIDSGMQMDQTPTSEQNILSSKPTPAQQGSLTSTGVDLVLSEVVSY